MAKLIDMKVDQKAREKRYKESTVAMDGGDEYPYGLRLRLGEEEIDKLGEDLPAVDTEMALVAVVKVTSVSSNESAGGGKNRSVELQVTKMCLEAPSKAKSAAAALYGESEE